VKRTETRHTCDTARSGSERSENTCRACHEEKRRRDEKHAPDYSWLYEGLNRTAK